MDSTCNVFVYGTLMNDRVLKTLGQQPILIKTATLKGYRRVVIQDAVYPVAIKDLNHEINGELHEILTSSLPGLDAYEGCHVDLYRRVEVTVECQGD